MPKVVALYSSAMQSGKSTAAQVFLAHGYVHVSFAEPLKKMIRTLLVNAGMDETIAWRHTNLDLKEEVIPGLNVTARKLMQTLGTEWGRLIDQDLWVNLAKVNIANLLDRGYNVVVDDVRYRNEADMLRKKFHAELYGIVRPGQVDTTGHSSEGALDDYGYFKDVIINDGTLDHFKQKINSLL